MTTEVTIGVGHTLLQPGNHSQGLKRIHLGRREFYDLPVSFDELEKNSREMGLSERVRDSYRGVGDVASDRVVWQLDIRHCFRSQSKGAVLYSTDAPVLLSIPAQAITNGSSVEVS